MEALGPICECLNCLPPFARRLSYIKDLKKNFRKLNNDVEDLCSRKADIDSEISRNTISKIPSTQCRTWLTKLDELVNQVKEIEQEISANKRCLNVCCFPDIFSRIKIGKRVANMLNKDVTRLKEAPIYMGGAVVLDAPPQVVERVPVPDTEGQTSTNRLVQDILTLIRDDKIRKIGLWGMGGVGKTTVMKILNNDPELERAFDVVIWVTVSKNWSVAGVQNEIMKRLGMNRMDNESNDSIARRLFRELEAKTYLLLLDDLWNEVNLEEVGIHVQSARIGNKIVLTTRNLLVCKKMGTDEDIKVQVLSKEEAWRLFREKVGNVIDSLSIEPIARQVVEECGGLPLAVIVIGEYMRKVKVVHAWETALEELRSASFKGTDMEDKVFNRLKFSYDHLESDDVKNCFLYCALYPEDYEIPVDELVKQWRDEGFIHGRQSLDKLYKKGLTLLDDLIDDSLLQRVSDDYVKMHDVMRDLALRITSPSGKGPRFFVQAGVGIKECEHTGEWEEAKRISLMGNSLSSLPTIPTCTSLETLLLQRNESLRTIPELFFKQIPRLRVVNLRETDIKVLPPSVSNLVNLRVLYLKEIYDDSISLPSEIGGLKRLEVLHIERIGSLPLEVRELSSLRSLRVGFDRNGEEAMRRMCCDGVISCLCLLEDLRFYLMTHYDYLRRKWDEMVKVGGVVEEVGSLKHLTSLKFRFPTTECLEQFVQKRSMMNCPEFTQFFLAVTGDEFRNQHHQPEIMGKQLIWGLSETIISSVIVVLLNRVWVFDPFGHKTVEKLSDFGMQNLNTLRECWVSSCLAMESIVSVADGIGGTIVLPNLQKLYLFYLPNLRSICDYPPSFTAIRELKISYCGKLRSVFTRSMIQHISNLEKLDVENCSNMEEIVGVRKAKDQVVDDAVLFFPRLKQLTLQDMEKLVRIWKGVSSQPWPSLEVVIVFNCPNLKTLNLKLMDNDHHNASSSSSSSALRKIQGEREWWEALEWEQNDAHQRLQPLFEKWGMG